MLGGKGLKALMQDKQHSQCLQVVALNRQLSYVVAWYFCLYLSRTTAARSCQVPNSLTERIFILQSKN